MNNRVYEQWLQDWHWILRVAETRQWDIQVPLTVLPPCSPATIGELLEETQIILPVEFVQVCTEFSSSVAFTWFMNEHDQEYIQDIFSGGSSPIWDVTKLKSCKSEYDYWVAECFPDLSDEYDKIWHYKTAFISVPNGDMIAFDISKGNINCPVVYLSHDGDDDAHGKILGKNFTDFISKWSHLGCPGTEFWQLEPFYNTATQEIDPISNNSQAWKKWLSA